MVVKSSDEFYVSNLGTCKECIKSKSKLQREILISTPEGLEKERERHRDKYHRLGYRDVHKPTPENKKKIQKAYKDKYPEKREAINNSTSIKRKVKGNHLHHWNYNLEYAKDVFELDVSGHGKLHRFLVYDTELYIYNKLDGTPLDTRDKHEALIKELEITIYN